MFPSRYLSGVGMWQDVRVLNPDRVKNLPLHLTGKTGSGYQPASYSTGSEDSWLGVKWPEREADHLLKSSAGVKNEWSFTSILNIQGYS